MTPSLHTAGRPDTAHALWLLKALGTAKIAAVREPGAGRRNGLRTCRTGPQTLRRHRLQATFSLCCNRPRTTSCSY